MNIKKLVLTIFIVLFSYNTGLKAGYGEFISKFVSNNKTPIAITCALGTVGLAYYLWNYSWSNSTPNATQSKKKTNDPADTNKTETIPPDESKKQPQEASNSIYEATQEPQIIHLDVLQQQSDAYCGYHSFYNAITAYETAFLTEFVAVNPDTRFTDSNNFDSKFQKWKTSVQTIRKKIALKIHLEKELVPYLKKDEDFSAEFQKMLTNCAIGLAEYAVESIIVDNKPYIINKKILTGILGKFPEYEYLADETSIVRHFPKIADIDIEITPDLITKLFKEKYITQNYDQWLEGNEIGELLMKTTNFEDVRSHISIVEDIEQLPLLDTFQKTNQEWKLLQNHFHIFIVGTMSEQNAVNKGHWFVLVAQKINGKIQYTVIDSLDETKQETASFSDELFDLSNSEMESITTDATAKRDRKIENKKKLVQSVIEKLNSDIVSERSINE